MKLTFTIRAARDLSRLRDFIERKNPQAANKTSHQLKRNMQALLDQPQLGMPIEDLENFRELIARDYIIRYRVLSDEIVILNIWHGKEDR